MKCTINYLIMGLFLLLPVGVHAQDSPAGSSPGGHRIEDGKLLETTAQDTREIPLPAPAVSLLRVGKTLYVALGTAGMVVVNLDDMGHGTVSHRVPVSHGAVTGFLKTDDKVWMQVDATTAVMISPQPVNDANTPGETITPVIQPLPGIPTPVVEEKAVVVPTTDSLAPPQIRIIEIRNGQVKLDAGSNQGIKADDQLVVFRRTALSRSGAPDFDGNVQVATLQVTAVNETTSLAAIWRGDRVSLSDGVIKHQKESRPSMIYPRHLTHLAEVEAVFRPIIAVGSDSGFGTLSDVKVSWWGSYYFVSVKMQPLGFGKRDDSKVVSNSLLAELGYNGRTFALGMGAGLASVNGDMDEMLQDRSLGSETAGDSTTETAPKWEQRTQHGFALSQTVRLGAVDGLNFSVSNVLIYHSDDADSAADEDRSGFIYGGTNGRFSWPMALRVSGFLEGGGGVMGYAFGAVGIFTWLRGNGDHGSIGISASAGFASVWGTRKSDASADTYPETIFITGPMFSLGARFRFGPPPDNKLIKTP